MKIALIGGSGFIGTVLCSKLLALGHEVVIGDKTSSEIYPELVQICDVRDFNSIVPVLEGCDVIYNLAAEHHDNVDPISLYYDVNVEGARNLLKAAEEKNIRSVIFTSSVAIYGFSATPATEDFPIQPFNDYGQSKANAEIVHREWLSKSDDRSLVIIRPTVVFGPKNRGNVYNLFSQMATKFSPMIGNGQNMKSMAYVENIADLLIWGMQQGVGEHIYNWSEQPDMTMNELFITVKKEMGETAKVGLRIPYWLGMVIGSCFDVLSKLSGLKFKVSAIRVKKFCGNTRFSSQKARDAGFLPQTSLEEGICRMIRAEFKK